MNNEYKFNVGDEVITVDGIKGTIVDICQCTWCQSRGFYEPIWKDEYGDETYITPYEARNGYEIYHKIGEYHFNQLRKDEVEKSIAHYESLLSRLRNQLAFIEELEKERKSDETSESN